MRSLVRDAATGAVRAVRAVVGDALVFHGGERCNPPDLDAAVAAADGIAAKAMRLARATVIERNRNDVEAFAYVLLNIYRLTAAQAKTLRRTAFVRACVRVCVRARLSVPGLQTATVSAACYVVFRAFCTKYQVMIDALVRLPVRYLMYSVGYPRGADTRCSLRRACGTVATVPCRTGARLPWVTAACPCTAYDARLRHGADYVSSGQGSGRARHHR